MRLGFSDELAHRIEAGADIFLMPSRYEPCGLNQLYSLKYGTVPVVHATGGLADTITNLTDETLAAGTANGFSFDTYTTGVLADTLERACHTYANRPVWEQLIRTGMQQDWSWNHSAREYDSLYKRMIARAATPAFGLPKKQFQNRLGEGNSPILLRGLAKSGQSPTVLKLLLIVWSGGRCPT